MAPLGSSLARGAARVALAAGLLGAPAPRLAPAAAAMPENPALLPKKVRQTWARLLRIEDGRLPARGVVPLLRDVDARVRALAVRSLGRLGDPESRVHLEPRLAADPDGAVRAAAALALGLLGSDEAVPALIKALADVDAAAMAARALGLLKATGAGADLARRADDPGAPAPLRAAALYALAALPEAEGAPDGLPPRPPEDPELRTASAYLLRRLAARPSFRPPATWLGSDAPEVRQALLLGLARREGAVPGELLGVLLPKDPAAAAAWPRDSRLALVAILPKLTSERAYPLWEVLLADPDLQVLLAALRAAPGAAGADAALRARLRVPVRLLEKRPDLPEAVAGALVEALAAVDPTRFGERRAAVLADPRVEVRAGLARALLGEGGLEAPDAFARRLWEDPDRRVRQAALEALAKRKQDWVEPLLRQALLSPEPPLAATAATALVDRQGDDGDDRLAPQLLQLVRRFPATHHEERVMLVDLLARLKAAALLARLEGDEDRLLSEHVHRLLGKPPPVRTGVGLADEDFYLANLVRYPPTPRVRVVTTRGDLEIRLDLPEAPLNCWNFLALATTGYYDGLTFHRVVPGFVAQGGDPRRDGFGGPGYMVRCERGMSRYVRGTVGMALAGKDTGGSQFFVSLADTPHLEGGYTVLGRVVRGLEVLDRLVPGDGILSMELVRPEGPRGE